MKACLHKTLLFFLLSLLFACPAAEADEKQADSDCYPITNFEIFEDVDGTYDFATISSPAGADKFQPYQQNALSLGISKSTFWIRFMLPLADPQAIDAKRLLQLGNPNISKIDLYIPVHDDKKSADIIYREKHVGAASASTPRDIWDADWIFPIPRHYANGQYVYLQLKSISTLRLPVQVWQENAFLQEAFLKNIGYGIFYGVLIAMFLYNLFIVFVLRDKTYLFYVLYLFFMFIYQFDVHGHLKLLLSMDYSLYNSLFWLFLAGGFIFSILFTACFLQVHEDEAVWPTMIKLLLAAAALQGIFGAFGYAVPANQLANSLGILAPLCFMALATFRFCQGFHPAIYYLLAWGILSLGIIIWITTPYRILGANILMLTTAAEAILLSLALSDRFKILRLKELALTQHVHYYRDLSLTDELTGLYNRRYLKKKMRQDITVAQLHEKDLALIVVDIDFFKKYNDAYGHWQGDQVLVRFSEVLLNVLDGSQMAFRFGGEEFVILLPNAAHDDAAAIAERIRSDFEGQDFSPTENALVHVTISAGLSILKANDTEETFFQRADKALYQAKAAGRNQVVCL